MTPHVCATSSDCTSIGSLLSDTSALALRDVERAIDAIRSIAPKACVILAGSTGTGELTRSPQGDLLSDIEIAVAGGVRALVAARRVRRGVRGVETYWVAPWRLRWGAKRNFEPPRPNVSAFDLVRQPRVGPLPRLARSPRVWEPTDLGAREAVSLILNRVAESMAEQTPYSRVKVAVACGDAILVAHGRYDVGYARRAQLFAALASELRHLYEAEILEAYEAKLTGRLVDISLEQLQALVTESIARIEPHVALDRWDRTYAALAAVWRLDMKKLTCWSGGSWGREVAVAVRAAARVGGTRTVRLYSFCRQPQVAVYAAVARAFVALMAATTTAALPGDVPAQLATDRDELLRLWRAFV